MESLFESSNRDYDEDTRRVNNAVFISKDREVSEESESEDNDTCSVVSRMTERTLKAWEGLALEDYNSDSSTSTTVCKLTPRRKEYDPEAYNKWLKAKTEAERKRKEQEQRRKKREETKKKLAEEKRKQESEEKLKQWMERKEKEKQRKQKESSKSKDAKPSQTKKKWIPNEESESTFRAWQNRVKQQEEERKLRLVAKQRMEEELKQERQQLSKLFYDEWLKTSASKPKPVPLNQGIDSLRGSISKMYINPVSWKSNID
ncbi:coiled-coil domain-containing protein 34 [Aedes albopictus]|uniref:Coiled-coil domain-containing protein n=1 Tax=Aedes albopictus TaxID=7160 RepID=A0ABM1ZI63_AEDAL|nr:coiled-coil domain-containing protein 34-like [Aedes albopictus]